MPVSAYLYPWDVDGDPEAADRIAGLGVTEVSLAAAYHAVRAVTPFHPRHRVVTRDAAVYYRPDPVRWRGAALRPADAGDGHAGSFERAAGALHAAGLRVNAWVVVAHNGHLGAAHPEYAVRNAYGDVYPWALCIGSPEVAAYAATLAAEVAALGGVDAIELEACGWYGYDHGSAHDKTGGVPPGVPPGGTAAGLLDACFCPACGRALRDAGADPADLARQVRDALDAGYQREDVAPAAPGPAGGQAIPGDLAGDPGDLADGSGDLAGTLTAVRAATAESFLRRVLTAVRSAAPGKDVFLHAHPDPREAGSNPGYDPAVLLGPDGADGIILACPGPPGASAALVERTARAAPAALAISAALIERIAPATSATSAIPATSAISAAPAAPATSAAPAKPAPPAGRRIAATLPSVTALGADTGQLTAKAAAVVAAGATDLRLYHAGLASAADHTAMREVAKAT